MSSTTVQAHMNGCMYDKESLDWVTSLATVSVQGSSHLVIPGDVQLVAHGAGGRDDVQRAWRAAAARRPQLHHTRALLVAQVLLQQEATCVS
jgi:hypothetical protein